MNARMVLSDDPGSVAAARRFVRATLASWGLEEHVDSATLLISELVTNALLHARSAPEVVLRSEGRVLRAEVRDTSPVLPARRNYGVQAGTGRGMVLVEEMASQWGAQPVPGGKVVWFELGPESRLDLSFSLQEISFDDIPALGEEPVGPARGAGDTRPAAGPERRRPGTSDRANARSRRPVVTGA